MKEKLNITLDSDIKEKLSQLANSKGLSISAYITSIVMDCDNPLHLMNNRESKIIIYTIKTLEEFYSERKKNNNSKSIASPDNIINMIEFQKDILRKKGYSDETIDFCILHVTSREQSE